MKKAAVFTLVAVLAVAAACLAVVARSQDPPDPDVVVDKVTICHATGSSSNPYNPQTVSADGTVSGHADHPNDIIPPFRYNGGTYPGKNWDDLGNQAIWYYGCDPSKVPDVTPTVQCVESRSDGLVAHFGYRAGSAATIEVGLVNRFDPDPPNRKQPVSFQAGTHDDVFTVPFSGELTWILAGKSATASSSSPKCQASIKIDKALDPSNDPGRFDLLLDGQALATGQGNSGTTGTRSVSTGTHTVGERASRGTNLADYDITIVCRANGGVGNPPVAQGPGPSIRVTVTAAQAIVCVIFNRRKEGPPGPGQYDLQVVKSATPRSVLVGQQVTWTVTVRNNGPGTATNVVVEDSLPDDMSFVEGSLVLPPGVTCIGARCTIASLAPGASVSGRFITTATAVGTKTNTVTVTSRGDTNPANNAASAQVLVTGGDEEDVSPILECVEQLSGGGYRAHFGYLNPGNAAVSVPVGRQNAFTPAPENRGQPVRFLPGRAPDVFQVDFRGTLVWTLTGKTSTATQSSEHCANAQGSLRVDKILSPPNDPGRFNLEIDGVPAGTGRNVGHLGTTGDVAVPAGQHRVGEEGVGGTSLANYDTTIACRANRGRGAVSSAFHGPELVVDVGAGQEVVCTITNTRRTGPPVPPPEPPPGPTPPPDPQPGTSDLSVVKFVNRRVAALGDVVTWTIVVTNNGPLTATGVTIRDDAAARTTIVSLQVSQGTCGRTTCSLGTIAPGASVRIVARTRMLIVGARLNVVIVRGDQPDSVPENNHASALIRVLSAFTPPLAQRCSSLSINRRVGVAGSRLRVRASVRNVFGRPLAGTVVRARGAGQLSAARTNRLGLAFLDLAPTQAGIVRFTVGARTLTAAGARRCRARIGVLALQGIQPGVTG